jgi:CheY-like chemotaxis protein
MGYLRREAQDREAAPARCKQSMPDLVLTDRNMPDRVGLTFVRRLRAVQTPREPVAVFPPRTARPGIFMMASRWARSIASSSRLMRRR